MNDVAQANVIAALQVARSTETISALRSLVDTREMRLYDSACERLAQRETIVAVIGRQGVGKSSLLSALLGRRVLPIDETETTNVLCAVRSTEGGIERAVVRFRDGRIEEGPATDEFLRNYTDEQENRGNMLGVVAVDLYLEHPLLAPGIVLVDTPGVGSITTSTGQVTIDFLPKISLGVFMMSTAPTLLDSESLFLRTTWSFSRNFLFVQNAWATSALEVEEGRRVNLANLEAIAREAGHEGSVELHVVDVHEGLEGQCNGDASRVQRSGLMQLVETIRTRALAGATRMRVLTNAPILLEVIRVAKKSAHSRLENIEEENLSDQKGFEDRQRLAYEELDAISNEWRNKVEEFRAAYRREVEGFRAKVDERVDEAEKILIGLARERKISAKALAKSVADQFTLAVKGPSDQIMREYQRHVRNLVEASDRLHKSSFDVSGHVVGIDKAAEIAEGHERFEKVGGGVQGIGGIGFAIIAGEAIWAGGAMLVAGEGVLAAVAAAGAAIPGVGLAIAGVAVVGGYLLKRWKEGKALDQLVPAIQDAARDTRRNASNGVKDAIQKHANVATEKLEAAMRASVEQQRNVIHNMGNDRATTLEERVALRNQFKSHMDELEKAQIPLLALAANGGEARS